MAKKVGSMLPEILKHLFRKKATVLYPFERIPTPEGFRGKPSYIPSKCGSKCKGICAMDCPAEAIIMKPDPREEGNVRPVFLIDRCIFCSQCVESCPFGAITMSSEFELTDYNKKALESQQW